MPTGGRADCQIDHKHATRGNGISAVGYAAYIGGEKMRDEETGRIYNYRRKTEVAFKKLFLPECAKGKFQTEEELWNSAQKQEKAKDARLALSLILPIPNELPLEAVKEIIDQFGTYLMEKSGGAVKLALHWKAGNHHLHAVMTERAFKETGEWDLKERKVYAMRPKIENGNYVYDEDGNAVMERVPMLEPDPDHPGQMRQVVNRKDRNRKMWKRVTVKSNPVNSPTFFPELREEWAEINNKFLTEERKMDPRSYKEQGLEKKPGKHLGPSAAALERKGIKTYRGDYNRAVAQENEEREEVKNIKKVETALQDDIAQTNANMLQLTREALEDIDERREKAGRRAAAIRSDSARQEIGSAGKSVNGSFLEISGNRRGEGKSATGVLSATVGKLRAAIRSLGRGIEKLRSAIDDFRSRKNNLGVAEREFETARTDAERRYNDLAAKLAKRRTMELSGRKDRRDRRDSR